MKGDREEVPGWNEACKHYPDMTWPHRGARRLGGPLYMARYSHGQYGMCSTADLKPVHGWQGLWSVTEDICQVLEPFECSRRCPEQNYRGEGEGDPLERPTGVREHTRCGSALFDITPCSCQNHTLNDRTWVSDLQQMHLETHFCLKHHHVTTILSNGNWTACCWAQRIRWGRDKAVNRLDSFSWHGILVILHTIRSWDRCKSSCDCAVNTEVQHVQYLLQWKSRLQKKIWQEQKNCQ